MLHQWRTIPKSVKIDGGQDDDLFSGGFLVLHVRIDEHTL